MKKVIGVAALRDRVVRKRVSGRDPVTARGAPDLRQALRISGPVAVLDDDWEAAASLCAGLRTQGLDAVAFSEPPTLWAGFLRTPFLAFVLDWTLETGTSAPLIACLRQHEQAAEAPIFLLSGSPAACGVPLDPDVAKAVSTYQLQFRAKPYSCIKLAAELRSILATMEAKPSGT